MEIPNTIKALVPQPIKKIRRMILGPGCKYDSELSYWRRRLLPDNEGFMNYDYQRIMLAMSEEPDDSFLEGKVVADFGCGPGGSLAWASSAHLRIGIDVLADRYSDEFKDNILSHGMIYLKSTEKVIPLPSGFVDVLFSLNAIDHAHYLNDICREILRVLKPGGHLIASLNLEEPPTTTEPHKLDEDIIRENLLKDLEIQSYRLAEQGPSEDRYRQFFGGNLQYKRGQKGYLWVKARKKMGL